MLMLESQCLFLLTRCEVASTTTSPRFLKGPLHASCSPAALPIIALARNPLV